MVKVAMMVMMVCVVVAVPLLAIAVSACTSSWQIGCRRASLLFFPFSLPDSNRRKQFLGRTFLGFAAFYVHGKDAAASRARSPPPFDTTRATTRPRAPSHGSAECRIFRVVLPLIARPIIRRRGEGKESHQKWGIQSS